MPEIPSCNLSYSINCLSTFANCYQFKQFKNGLQLNFVFPNATNMAYMFTNCSSITTNINIGQTKKVTDMTDMFKNCYNLKSINNHKDYRIDLTNAFYNNMAVQSIPELDCINVYSLNNTFYECSNLNSINIKNTKYVKNMANIFYKCSQLTEIPDTFATNAAQNLEYAFYRCNALTKLPTINCQSISVGNHLHGTFAECENLTEINLKNTNKVKNIQSLCYNCIRLQKITGLDLKNCTNAYYAFYNAHELSCINTTEYPTLDFSNVTNTSLYYTFYNCYNLSSITNFGIVPNSTRNAKWMDGIFYYSKIKSINGHTWEEAIVNNDPYTHDPETGEVYPKPPPGTTFGFCTSSVLGCSQLVYGSHEYVINLDLRNAGWFTLQGSGPRVISGLQFSEKLAALNLEDCYATYLPDIIPSHNIKSFACLFGKFINGRIAFSFAPFIHDTDAYPSGLINAELYSDLIPEYDHINWAVKELYLGVYVTDKPPIPFFPKLYTENSTKFERMYFMCSALTEINYCLDLQKTNFDYKTNTTITGTLEYAWELERFSNIDYANFNINYTNYSMVNNKNIYTAVQKNKGTVIISSVADNIYIEKILSAGLAHRDELLKNGSLLRNMFYNCTNLENIDEIIGIKFDINFCFTKLNDNSIIKVVSALNTEPQGPVSCLYLSHNELTSLINLLDTNQYGTHIAGTNIYTTTHYDNHTITWEKIAIPTNIETENPSLCSYLYDKIPYHEFEPFKGQYFLSGNNGWNILSCFTPIKSNDLPCKKHLLSAYVYEKIF